MEYNKEQVRRIPSIPKETIQLFNELNKQVSLDSILKDKELLKRLSYDYIHGSAFLEGNTYTFGGLTALIERRITADDKTIDEANMILNLKRSVDFSLAVKDENLSIKLIKEFHSCLSKTLVPENSEGVLRTGAVFITGTNYVPLRDAPMIEEELNYIVEKSATIQCPYTKAIYLQLNLSYLQAFLDVNKIIARTVSFHTLLSNNIVPLFMSKSSAERGFIDAVLTYYDYGTSEEFINWFTNAYLGMYQKLTGKLITLDDPIDRSNLLGKY